ncbi:MAG: RecX family transcriptional regulator [Bacilli bacterium]|nr:RecX family transcriptional regulator [Bacilli bacterium]
MKIEKFIKDKTNKYKVIIDDDEYKLYDDIIIKYHLLTKKDITKKELDEVLSSNDELTSYYESIKYINRKMRCEKEIREYLKKKDIPNNIINKTIKLLYDNNFLNEELYLKAYINDRINLSHEGPIIIKEELMNLGYKGEDIDNQLNTISSDIWNDRIDTIISKRISTNKKDSSYVLKNKIILYLVNLGYNKEDILSILNRYDIIDKEIYEKEKVKIYNQLSKKYSGYELDKRVKMKLYQKGFKGSGNYEE